MAQSVDDPSLLLPPAKLKIEDIVITHELSSRPIRTVNSAAEAEALRTLTRVMATSPTDLTETLLRLALELCRADTAGLSLLETAPHGEQIFRWTNLAGVFRAHVGGFTPRNFSPCGTCLDRNSPQLFWYPSRLFQYLNRVDTPIVEALVVPLVPIGEDPLGTIWILTHQEEKHFDGEDVRIMTSLAEFTSTALRLERTLEAERQARQRGEAEIAERELAQEALRQSHAKLEYLVEQRTAALRRLSISLLQSQDEERRRFARNLHDSIGQYLTSLKLNLLQLTPRSGQHFVKSELLSECLHTVDECLNETRTISYLLHPPLLDEAGFASAARWYIDGFAQRTGIQAKLQLSPKLDRLSSQIEVALFRILQESLTNVHRHSGSPTVEIGVDVDTETVTLAIRDAGRGVPEQVLSHFRETGTAGIGLAGMRERVADLGGQLQVESNGSGTLLKATIPLSAAASSSTQHSSAA